jgi:hypothetical protein
MLGALCIVPLFLFFLHGLRGYAQLTAQGVGD